MALAALRRLDGNHTRAGSGLVLQLVKALIRQAEQRAFLIAVLRVHRHAEIQRHAHLQPQRLHVVSEQINLCRRDTSLNQLAQKISTPYTPSHHAGEG